MHTLSRGRRNLCKIEVGVVNDVIIMSCHNIPDVVWCWREVRAEVSSRESDELSQSGRTDWYCQILEEWLQCVCVSVCE